jgi:hypothetical protein
MNRVAWIHHLKSNREPSASWVHFRWQLHLRQRGMFPPAMLPVTQEGPLQPAVHPLELDYGAVDAPFETPWTQAVLKPNGLLLRRSLGPASVLEAELSDSPVLVARWWTRDPSGRVEEVPELYLPALLMAQNAADLTGSCVLAQCMVAAHAELAADLQRERGQIQETSPGDQKAMRDPSGWDQRTRALWQRAALDQLAELEAGLKRLEYVARALRGGLPLE